MGPDPRFEVLARALLIGMPEETILALAYRLQAQAEDYLNERDLPFVPYIAPREYTHEQKLFYALGNGAIVCSCGFATTFTTMMNAESQARDHFHTMHTAFIKRMGRLL